MTSIRQFTTAAVLAGFLAGAQAHSAASEASALSALPIAVSIAAPAVLLSAGAALSVVAVAVEHSAAGVVCVLERASDGARTTLRLSGQAAAGLSLAAGTVVVVTAVGTGWVLSTASRAIAFVPNEIGSALLYNERVTR